MRRRVYSDYKRLPNKDLVDELLRDFEEELKNRPLVAKDLHQGLQKKKSHDLLTDLMAIRSPKKSLPIFH